MFLPIAIVTLRPTYFVFHPVERFRSRASFGHHNMLQKDNQVLLMMFSCVDHCRVSDSINLR
jgi:hypothetical protein